MKKIFALILTVLMASLVFSAFAAEDAYILPYDSSWEVTASSEFNNKKIANVFDGRVDTYWHTNYTAEGPNITGKDEAPHTITVNFGKELSLNGWIYTPRTDNATGMFHTYNLYASTDGVNFELFHKGKLPYPGGAKAPQTEMFEAKKMKAIKIEATDPTGGFGTCAELQFLTPENTGVKAEGKKEEVKTEATNDGDILKYDGKWTITATSELSNKPVANAFDGREDTFWHSDYTAEGSEITKKDNLPISVIVDFGENITLGGWAYAPRTDNGTGMFRKYNLYASKDGVNFELFHTASIPYPAGERVPQVAAFEKREMRAIKIEAIEAAADFATAVEIWFYKNSPDFKIANFDGTKKGGDAGTTPSAPAPEVKPTVGTATGAVTASGKNRAGLSYLDRTGWTGEGVSFQANPVAKALDGSITSHWHSNYGVKDGTVVDRSIPPYELEFTLRDATFASGITLHPRDDMKLGRILKLNVYGKETEDGKYYKLYENLEFSDDAEEKEIPFTSNLKLKKVKLEILESAQSFGTLGEFNLWERNPSLPDGEAKTYFEDNARDRLYKVDNSAFSAIYDGDSWAENTPEKVFDGTGAFWQTETIEEFPVVLKVDLGKVYGIKEMTYKPRQSEDCHGAWGLVSVYVSTDGETWEAAAVGVKMPINKDIKKITFDKEIDVRFMEIEVEEAHAKRVSCCEIEFYQSKEAYDKSHIVTKEKYELKIGSNVITSDINGEVKEKNLDVAPYIVNGSTLIPLRGLVEEMGAEIAWDGDTKSITLKIPGRTIVLQIWNNLVYVKDNKLGDIMYTLLNFPVIKDSRTFIPVRFVSEQLGYNVAWDGATQTVTITN